MWTHLPRTFHTDLFYKGSSTLPPLAQPSPRRFTLRTENGPRAPLAATVLLCSHSEVGPVPGWMSWVLSNDSCPSHHPSKLGGRSQHGIGWFPQPALSSFHVESNRVLGTVCFTQAPWNYPRVCFQDILSPESLLRIGTGGRVQIFLWNCMQGFQYFSGESLKVTGYFHTLPFLLKG